MGQVTGKVALVTGGASGIGRATALTLGREGAAVMVTDLSEAGAQAVADEIVAAGGKAQALQQDTTDEDRWQAVVAATEAAFGKLDVLVNNAGIAIAGPIETFSLADWRKQQAVNVEGVFLGVKHAFPAMRRAGGGSIVNLSSIAGLRGNRTGLGAYSATKGAVRLFTKTAALEGAKEKIRVNSVHPGIIETPIWDAILPGGQAGRNAGDLNTRASASVPTGVLGQPQDIANGILFLASDQSSYMTGSELVIDAGVTAG
ncbi:MAG: glucose 1-dehydrogenase [Alphaproteobacteria bacterium]|nr:glucose 1-dehydrogenase [Alphaproteobacteria bacterium]MCB9930760.1 glucose 1-dehydrogenase [Alphaproteobacteria bacterium]